MYENSQEYFKKLQKRFKNTICDTEPNLQDSGIEDYAYGYHSSSTVTDCCSFGLASSYAAATIPCLMTCFKFLILPKKKSFVTRGAIVSRLHVAVEYLSKFNYVSTNKTKKSNFFCLIL